jgi:hypothetical protein
MGPIGCPKIPARNYHNMLHNNAEKHRSQYHYFDYFGGWVGSRPGLDLLAKRKLLSLMRIESRSQTIILYKI